MYVYIIVDIPLAVRTILKDVVLDANEPIESFVIHTCYLFETRLQHLNMYVASSYFKGLVTS